MHINVSYQTSPNKMHISVQMRWKGLGLIFSREQKILLESVLVQQFYGRLHYYSIYVI